MKIRHLYATITVLAALLAACSKDKTVQTNTVTVTTGDVTSITSTTATLNGAITNDAGNNATRGFCYGMNSNPVVGSGTAIISADGAGNGSFSANITYLTPGTLYHVRAYSLNGVGTDYVYGEDKTFTTTDKATLVTGAVTNITAITAHFKGNYTISEGQTADIRGYAYGTTANPTISNGSVGNYIQATGTGTYELDAANLAPNTTYYVRAYTQLNDGSIVYDASQQTFKTVGYLGSGGGYVVLDKGDTTGGWRFLEAAPESISYFGSGGGYSWGCDTHVISQTSSTLGAGPANTAHIIAGCTEPICAARGCDNYAINGLSDWFLPSQDEMVYTYTTLQAMNVIVNDSYWTSTELGQSNAAYVYYSAGLIQHSTSIKGDYYQVQPVRRFK